MKKAKIMLIATAVIAVVGGLLAFKTRTTTSIPSICYTLQNPGANGFCAFGTSAFIIANGNEDFDAFYSTEEIPANVDPDEFCTTIHCDQFGPVGFKVSLTN